MCTSRHPDSEAVGGAVSSQQVIACGSTATTDAIVHTVIYQHHALLTTVSISDTCNWFKDLQCCQGLDLNSHLSVFILAYGFYIISLDGIKNLYF